MHPVAALQNFRCLCTGERGVGKNTGKAQDAPACRMPLQSPVVYAALQALHFKNTFFHRIIQGFMMQAFASLVGAGKAGWAQAETLVRAGWRLLQHEWHRRREHLRYATACLFG